MKAPTTTRHCKPKALVLALVVGLIHTAVFLYKSYPPSSGVSDQLLVDVVQPSSSVPRFVMNDPTLQLSRNISRPWMTNKGAAIIKPGAKILLTDYGWNHPNRTQGLQFSRSIRLRQLIQAVVDHPWFDIHGWDHVQNKNGTIDPSLRYYVFLDVETCFESNYPAYTGPGGYEKNADRTGGRTVAPKETSDCYNIWKCRFLTRVLASRLFRESTSRAKLVFLECRGDGPPVMFRKEIQPSEKLALVTVSSGADQLIGSVDQGLPPPAVSPIVMTDLQLDHLYQCHPRTYLLSFVGNVRPNSPRAQLLKLNNNRDMLLLPTPDFKTTSNLSYSTLLLESHFAATPRGDNRFSYRFTEVLSAGAIPVVHSDGWVLPFRKELIDWTECAVVIPEKNVPQTESILRSIPTDKRCKMQQRCFQIYQQYMATPEGTLNGIIEGLELVALGNQNT